MILPELRDGAVAGWVIVLTLIAEVVVAYWP